MRTTLFIALRHLLARRRQSLVATVGMGIGVAVLIAMTSMMKGFEEKFLHETLRVSPHVTITDEERHATPPEITRREALERRFPDARIGTRRPRPPDRPRRIKQPGELIRWVRAQPGVSAAAGALVGEAFVAFGGKRWPTEVRGVDPVEQEKVTPVSEYVVAGTYEALGAQPDSILLGAGVAEELGAKVGDRVIVAAPGREGISVEVIGIADTGIPPVDRSRAFVPIRTAQALLAQPDTVNHVGIKLDDPGRADEVAAMLDAVTGYETESWREQNANWLGIFALQQMITRVIVSAIVIVAAFGILNILIMIVLEKKRDIAILRSVGLTRGDIQRVFLVEGAIMGLVGATLGCLLGAFVMWQLGRLEVRVEGIVKTERFLLSRDPWLFVSGAAFALAASLVASILPARRAAATEPVDVIRGQV